MIPQETHQHSGLKSRFLCPGWSPSRDPLAPRGASRSVYLSDGGVLENTGILALLQRRQRRILAVYTGEESVGQDGMGMGQDGMGMGAKLLGESPENTEASISQKFGRRETGYIYIHTLCYITYYFLF